MSNTYHSSTRGHMRASHKTKKLMQALRVAVQNCVAGAFVESHGSYAFDWTEISERRADIVAYIGQLEADLAVHQAQRAEDVRRAAVRRGTDTSPYPFKLRDYQKQALRTIMEDTPPGFEDLTFHSSRYMKEGVRPTDKVFGVEAAQLFGSDKPRTTIRIGLPSPSSRVNIDRMYAKMVQDRREAAIVAQGIA